MPMIGSLVGSFFAGERPAAPVSIPPAAPQEAPNTLSGFATTVGLLAYFAPKPGSAYRFKLGNPLLREIKFGPLLYNQIEFGNYPVKIITRDWISASTKPTYEFDATFNGNVDDGWYTVTPPWKINYLGKLWDKIYVGTNSYVTFEAGSAVYSGLNYGSPSLPKFMISSADNSMQVFRCGLYRKNQIGSRVFAVCFEGVNQLYYINPVTGGTNVEHFATPFNQYRPGEGPMVWEAWFYEEDPDTIDIHIIANSKWLG